MSDGLVLARIVHVLSAAVWVGGTIFLAAVAVPFARTLDPERRTEVVTALGRRFRPVAWTALGGLVASGIYTLHGYGLLTLDAIRSGGYSRGLIVKLSLVLIVLVLAAVHDLVLGPRFERTGTGRARIVMLARVNGLLTVAVLVIGVWLAH